MPNIRLRRVGAALRRRWVPIIAAGVAVAVVGGGAGAALAAQPTTASLTVASTSTSTSSTTPHACAPGVGRLLAALPGSLRADLKTLRTDPASKKAAERAEIKRKALAGDYGTQVERVSKIVAGDGGRIVSAIPAAMKADLKTLRADPKGSAARTAEAATIWKKAVAGSYGSTIESLAKDAQAHLQQRCTAGSTTH